MPHLAAPLHPAQVPNRTRLDEVLLSHRLFRWRRRARPSDERIVACIDDLMRTPRNAYLQLSGPITRPADHPADSLPALMHFFNHQTHHRGQAHTLLTIPGGRDAAPSLDLLYFQRETGIGLA